MHHLVKASAGLALLVASGSASAHARLKVSGSIPPRSESSGLKTGPCGDIAPTTDPAKRTTLTAGQTLTVEWEETINHRGYFKISFSPKGDVNWTGLSPEITDPDDGPIPNNAPISRSTQVTVPGQNCEKCTIQLVQFMMDNNKFYYSCADVRITGGTPEPVSSDTTTSTETGTETASDTASGTETSAAADDSTSKLTAPSGLKVQVKQPKGGQ
jgi:hypothetical protein